jgi:hypothetical protein
MRGSMALSVWLGGTHASQADLCLSLVKREGERPLPG